MNLFGFLKRKSRYPDVRMDRDQIIDLLIRELRSNSNAMAELSSPLPISSNLPLDSTRGRVEELREILGIIGVDPSKLK